MKPEPITIRAAQAAVRQQPLYRHPSAYLWERCLSIGNQFCDAVVRAGYLSWEQMVNAACRYCIGTTKRSGVIFWQIDQAGRVHDGKVMYYLPDCHRNKSKAAHPTWVSTFLARREAAAAGTGKQAPSANHQASTHCLFGLHLLTSDVRVQQEEVTVCVVEAEKSAFILSERYPAYIWLASGGLSELQPDKFRPLQGRKVVLFPDTDPDGIAFRRWWEVADQVMCSPFWEGSPPIRVAPLLEQHATAEQKARKIDPVDYYFESAAGTLTVATRLSPGLAPKPYGLEG